MEEWYADNRTPQMGNPKRREAALSRVGPLLYEKIFKHYTKKQWDKYGGIRCLRLAVSSLSNINR